MRLTQRPQMLKTLLARHARVKRKIFVGSNGMNVIYTFFIRRAPLNFC